jgi:hypothetical protein
MDLRIDFRFEARAKEFYASVCERFGAYYVDEILEAHLKKVQCKCRRWLKCKHAESTVNLLETIQ